MHSVHPAHSTDQNPPTWRAAILGLGWAFTLLVLGFVIWLLSPVLLPFVIAFTLAFLLDPVVRWFSNQGVPRAVAAICVALTAFGSILVALAVAIPLLISQGSALIAEFPTSFEEAKDRFEDVIPGALEGTIDDMEDVGTGIVDSLRDYAGNAVSQLGAGFAGVFDFFKFWVVMPVVTVYLLIDWPRFTAGLDRVLPRPAAPKLREIGRDIENTLSGYIRGQSTVCAILIVYYSAALSLIGLPFAVTVGIVTGAVSFIPYIGMFIGTSIGMGVALWQFWGDWIWIAAVGGIYGFGLLVESEFLVPKLVGDAVNLHPVWLIFAVLAFGSLFGFIGALAAVPLAAALGVIVRHGMAQYYDSALYQGTNRRSSGLLSND